MGASCRTIILIVVELEPPPLDAIMVWFESPNSLAVPEIDPSEKKDKPRGNSGSMFHSSGAPPSISGAIIPHGFVNSQE